jgi:uncharacterized lipoprotein YddW (UPF0748 family)
MNRRQFLTSVGASAAGMAVARVPPRTGVPRAAGSGLPAAPPRKHWAWLRGEFATADAWQRKLATIKAAGIEAVLYTANPDFYHAHAAAAERAGLELHAWMFTMMRGENATAHPDWYAVSRDGVSTAVKPPYVDYYKFMCPSREDVRAYLAGLVREVAQTDGLAGVHLDYIRYPDVILPVALWPKYNLVQDKEYPPFDFCYCDVCCARFARESGVDPRKMPDPTADVAWRQFRYDRISEVVSLLADVAHAHGKLITAAVFPTPAIARALVRQDWTTWPLDAVLPMTYHAFYKQDVAWIERAVREGVRGLGARRPLYSGLYTPDLPPADLERAVGYAIAGGANGISIFEANGLTPDQWSALASALAARTAR